MDSKCFRYFIEVYECGSINKAAKHLGLSQPNLSVCIKNAEKELGFSVFSRNNNRIQLTSEGELFLKSARKIVRELDAIGTSLLFLQIREIFRFQVPILLIL